MIDGVLPVLSTPFSDDWTIDNTSLRREVDWLFANGADGIVIAMVSEVLRLTHRERIELAEAVVAAVEGRGAIITSVGCESTDQAVALVHHARRAGVDAVMANPPLTATQLPDSSKLDYFDQIVEAAAGVPVVIQDASGYIGSPIGTDLMATLLRRHGAEHVWFKPEAEPLGTRLTSLLDQTEGQARVFEGSGGRALVDNHHRGIVGTMPGADLVWAIAALWEALETKDDERAYGIQEALTPLLGLVAGLDTYVALEKFLLTRQGVLPSSRQRQPVSFELDADTAAESERLVRRLARAVGHDIAWID